MSILEKLKDLVKALEVEGEEQETTEETVASEEPQPEEPIVAEEEVKEEQLPEAEIEEFPHYLECTLEESVLISDKLTELRDTKLALGEMVSLFEERKQNMLSQLVSTKKQLLAQIESLRLEYGVPQEGYQVQLPSSPEDKVSFSKKE